MAKNKEGRPTKMTPDTVKKLEEAFSLGCSDVEACIFADISKQTLYNYIDKKPEFLDRKEALKKLIPLKARAVILHHLEQNDLSTAKYVLDKEDGRAKQAVEVSSEAEKPLIVRIIDDVPEC